ncbi:lysylphosphatidylglycerol synthase domain-containing protein [Brachybacterium paraconglomeratum]|uniref:lysylphosphatidylglycerol synthase domain-containing protein n=1 Tax=Brachybacterium paraconglomeratum TaxID=173362 RepID=UPI0031EB49A0
MSAASPGSPDSPDPDVMPFGARGAHGTEPAQLDPDWLAQELSEFDAERPPRLTPGRLVAGLLSGVLVIALLAWVLPWATGASWTEIGSTLSSLPLWALPAMVVLGVGALVLESFTVRAALPASRWSPALLGHAASSATALAIPGGSVLGLGLMGWILRRSGLALPLIFTGIVAASLVEMVITSVLIPLLGLASYALSSLLSPTGITLPGALWAALLALLGAVLALALTAVLLRRIVLTKILTQFGQSLPEHIAREILTQRDALVQMLRRRPLQLVAPTIGARVLQWIALLVAIEAVGAAVPLALTVAIFALGRVLSLVPLTPGGAGVSEAVGAAALVALGVGAAESAAAMLLLLVTMLLVPLLCGALAAVVALSRAPERRSTR